MSEPTAPQGASETEVHKPRALVAAFAVLVGRRAGAWLLAGAIGSLVLGLVELAVAVVLQLLLRNLGLLGKDVETLPMLRGLALSSAGLSAALFGIGVVRAGCQFLATQSANVAQEAVTARLRRFALYEMLLHPDRRFVPAARVNAQIGDLAVRASTFAYLAVAVMTAVIQAGTLLVIMLIGAPYEAIVALVGLFVIGLAVMYLTGRARRIVQDVPEQLRVLVEGIERVARNTLLVRALRTQASEHKRLVKAVDLYQSKSVSGAVLASSSVAATPLFGVLLILVVLTMSQQVLHTAPLVLVSFLYVFMRFVQQISTGVAYLATCNQLWPQTRVSLAYIADLGREHTSAAISVFPPVEARGAHPKPADRGTPPTIEVRGLSFQYPGQKTLVLQDLDVSVEPGTQLGIVGPSGRGKSTLLSLLLGLIDPTQGTVRLASRPPAEYFADPAVRVGYVGAEAFLVAGSIRENLRYGAAFSTSDDDLWAALAAAKLEVTVRGLEGGLDYLVAEDGSGLSAGQKQRLCLARALLSDPHVLVLDEASANLDEGTESEIAASIRELSGRTTVVVVSHRKGLLAYADRVIELAGPRPAPGAAEDPQGSPDDAV